MTYIYSMILFDL